jgi:hypothetical protein
MKPRTCGGIICVIVRISPFSVFEHSYRFVTIVGGALAIVTMSSRIINALERGSTDKAGAAGDRATDDRAGSGVARRRTVARAGVAGRQSSFTDRRVVSGSC